MPNQDPYDFTDRYNTKLSEKEEAQFQAEMGDRLGELYDYDLRGAWKELKNGTMTADERGHLGDKYKKPNHMTFSDDSKYHGVDGYKGGHWENGNYIVGPTTRAMYSDEDLERYRQRVEPNAQFILDPAVHKNGYTGKDDKPLEEPLIGPDTLIGMGTGFLRNMGINALNKMSGLASKVFSQKLNPTAVTKAYNGLLGASGSLAGDKAQDAAVDYVKDGLASYYGQKPHTYVLGGGSGLVDLGNGKFAETLPDGTTVQYSGIAPEDMIATQVDMRNNVDRDRSLILDAAQQTARFITNEASRRKPNAFVVDTPQIASGPRG